MNDHETAAHLRKWCADDRNHSAFSWPTDACGYDQSIRFAEHRNRNWRGNPGDEYIAFVLAYADSLEAK